MRSDAAAPGGFLAGSGFNLLTVFNLSQKAGHVGAWVYCLDTTEFWWSDEVYEMFGLPSSFPVNRELFFGAVHPEDRATVEAMFEKALEGEPYHITHRIVVNGEVLWVSERAQLYYDQQRQTELVVGMVLDVNKDMSHKLEIERQNNELTAIKEYFAQTSACTGILDIVKAAQANIAKIVRHVSISMVVTGDDDRMNFFMTQKDAVKYFGVKPQNRPRYLGFEAMRAQTELFVPVSTHADPHLRISLIASGVKSLTSFPIIYDGRAFAALTIASAEETPLAQSEKSFCQTMCGYLSFQLKNATLGQKVQTESTHRQLAEDDINTIFQESLDFISIVDENGYFKRINPVFAKKLGFGKKYLATTPVYDIACPEDRERTRKAVMDTVKSGYVRGFRNSLVCSDGSLLSVEWNAKYVPLRGYTIVISRDITKQLEYEKINYELTKSVEIEQLKIEFFANLSHEFKTPLNIILSSLQMVELQCSAKNVPQTAKYIHYIEQNSMRLLRLANNLIDCSKMDSDFMGTLLQEGNIVQAVKSITQSCAAYAAAKQLTITFETGLAQCVLYFDHNLLDRIMLNLLSNSIKHTASGGSIYVTLSEDDNFIKVDVRDNGAGIPPEMLPVIFDRFRVVANSFRRNGDGSGLGLAIVKALVELHHGTVSVHSKEGSGSAFAFTIAKNLAPDPAQPLSGGQGALFLYDEDVRKNHVCMEMS